MNYLIVIGGATATGKTRLSIELAQHFGAEIISADSRQFYREMEIGTAKPHREELAAAPHHGINTLSVEDPYSVGAFEQFALEILESLFAKNRFAILVGGSGLFIRAVCEGLDQFPEISQETKDAVETGMEQGGLSWMQDQLKKYDPEYFEQVDQQNPARLRRALEVCIESGQPYSYFLNKDKPARPFTPIYILLDVERETLYQRINDRVDAMLEAGLEEEARHLLPHRHQIALKTVGYEEWFDFFDGKTNREEAIDKIKQHSRNYAKRQATWFRKYGTWKAFHPEDTEEIIRYIQSVTTD
jgi:tRNA dimethylallyltransferase